MGRKKALSKQDIFTVTGKLLREEGLHAIHFKRLALELDVSRSTLYEYYKNKEALILAFMKSLMDEMNAQIDAISEDLPPNEKVFCLLKVILHHAHLHQIDHMIREVQTTDQDTALFYRSELHQDLKGTYAKMIGWMEEAKAKGIWEEETNISLIGDIFFHSILFRSRDKLGVDDLAHQLFQMVEQGVRKEL